MNFVIGQYEAVAVLLMNLVSSRVAVEVSSPPAKLLGKEKSGIYPASIVTVHTTMVIGLEVVDFPSATSTSNVTGNWPITEVSSVSDLQANDASGGVGHPGCVTPEGREAE